MRFKLGIFRVGESILHQTKRGDLASRSFRIYIVNDRNEVH
jgi:hypothetical protein